jgi:hypothetical protein
MSALLPKADMCGALAYVCFGPKADIYAVLTRLFVSSQWRAKRDREGLTGPREAQLPAIERYRQTHLQNRGKQNIARRPHCRSACRRAAGPANRRTLTQSARCRPRALPKRQRRQVLHRATTARPARAKSAMPTRSRFLQPQQKSAPFSSPDYTQQLVLEAATAWLAAPVRA